MRVTRPLPALALLAFVVICHSGSARAAPVTVYRCTDDRGRTTLGDVPCAKNQQQQAREMLRPQDPPARTAPSPPQATPAAVAPTTHIIVVTPPHPTYECVTPDGEVYLSQSSTGELRWQPLWLLGPVVPGGHRRFDHSRFDHRRNDGLAPVATPRTLDGRLQRPGLVFDNVGRPTPKPPGDRPGAPLPPPATGIAYASGAWIRDPCYPLPPQEVCARLHDRRYELDRRYHSALQSERTRISQQQRAIDAQLASECAAH